MVDDTRPETRAEPPTLWVVWCRWCGAEEGTSAGDAACLESADDAHDFSEMEEWSQPDAVEALEDRLREAAVAHFGEVAESVDVEIAGFVRTSGTPDQASAIYEAEARFDPPDDYVVTFSFHSSALTTDEEGDWRQRFEAARKRNPSIYRAKDARSTTDEEGDDG